jgi:hypothetical protein
VFRVRPGFWDRLIYEQHLPGKTVTKLIRMLTTLPTIDLASRPAILHEIDDEVMTYFALCLIGHDLGSRDPSESEADHEREPERKNSSHGLCTPCAA